MALNGLLVITDLDSNQSQALAGSLSFGYCHCLECGKIISVLQPESNFGAAVMRLRPAREHDFTLECWLDIHHATPAARLAARIAFSILRCFLRPAASMASASLGVISRSARAPCIS